ncbi:LysR family transcriptional regulator [Nakamurella silvestris]|nr:LysR family transcriptional regulator [Nakamurella silvestris]
MDVSAASVRSFLVLAKELHFGRAAKILRISTPSLSKQIVRLEAQVGESLFDRSPRQISLTAAGRDFLPVAQEVNKAFENLRTWTERTRGDHGRTLTIGIVGAGLGSYTAPVIAAISEQLPGLRVAIQRIELADYVLADSSRAVDVVFGSRIAGAGYEDAVVLASFVDPRVLMVAKDHRFAGRESVTLEETNAETYIRVGTPALEGVLKAWMIDPRPDGTSLRWGPRVDHLDDVMDMCAAGLGVNLSVQSTRSRYQREDLAWVPVTGTPPGHLEITARPGHRDPVVDRVVEIAVGLAAASTEFP